MESQTCSVLESYLTAYQVQFVYSLVFAFSFPHGRPSAL